MKVNELIAIANFVGNDATDRQVDQWIDEIKALSIADRERVSSNLDGHCQRLYNAIRENECELRGYSHW